MPAPDSLEPLAIRCEGRRTNRAAKFPAKPPARARPSQERPVASERLADWPRRARTPHLRTPDRLSAGKSWPQPKANGRKAQ